MPNFMGPNYILETDETEGREFSINGKHQILVMMPGTTAWGSRKVTLQYKSPHENENNWKNVAFGTDHEEIAWTGEGFLEVEGGVGILYRLSVNTAGCHATIHEVRNWISSRPGR